VPNPKSPDRNYPLELGLPGLAGLRRNRQDSRGQGAQPVAYFDETGRPLALTGDEYGPYVQNVPQLPRLINHIPNPQSGVGALILGESGTRRVFEVWAGDYRDQTASPPTYYLQVFDQADQPTGLEVPSAAPLPICGWAAYTWSYDATIFVNGFWAAVSSSPLIYTPVSGPGEYLGLSARVTP
jgi:hypothetical protein